MAGVPAESPGSDRGVRLLHRADGGIQTTLLVFVIEHRRRKILYSSVTRHPTAEWIVQQLRETFPETCPYPYVILDRDAKFGDEVFTFLTATSLKPKQTSVQAPWQNSIAERWVGSCRREILEDGIHDSL